jgi:hypothetical protein
MRKELDKQYFADAIADQQGFLRCLRLMPNNINTCKLIERTLEDNDYEYYDPTKARRAKYITNRNNRTRRMYIVIWSDHTYDYYDVAANVLDIEHFNRHFPYAYVTSRNAVEATLQVIKAFKQHNEQYKED